MGWQWSGSKSWGKGWGWQQPSREKAFAVHVGASCAAIVLQRRVGNVSVVRLLRRFKTNEVQSNSIRMEMEIIKISRILRHNKNQQNSPPAADSDEVVLLGKLLEPVLAVIAPDDAHANMLRSYVDAVKSGKPANRVAVPQGPSTAERVDAAHIRARRALQALDKSHCLGHSPSGRT